MTAGMHAADRAVLRVSGGEARKFLQGLVTNDVDGVDHGPVYAALLTPQGKYLFDFFLIADGDDILLDVKAEAAPALARRLSLYKLRADVSIEATDIAVVVGHGAPPAASGVFTDPRHPDLGWRAVGSGVLALLDGMTQLDGPEYELRRIELGVPETGAELLSDDSYILEMGFERINGVDFKKGCYVGQEVTARMKHKTELRKGLARVSVQGPTPPNGAEIVSNGKAAGTLRSVVGDEGLAYLRFDRADGAMTAGEAVVTRIE